MLYPEQDAPLLKKWIIRRLENTSDADPDVLADYVLALLSGDGDEASIRVLCEKEMHDFLKEDSAVFVDDVLKTIKYKSYLPGAPPPPAEPLTKPTLPDASNPKKRTFTERDDSDEAVTNGREKVPFERGRKAKKGGSRGDTQGSRPLSGQLGGPQSHGEGMAPLPLPPPQGMPSMQQGHMDPMEAMRAMLQMQQAMGLHVPGMANFAAQMQSAQGPRNGRKKRKCRDFMTKGFCARGYDCHFDHGSEPAIPQGVMESFQDVQGEQPPQGESRNGRGSHRRRGGKIKRKAPFSADGAVHDRSKSTIVVENIPEANFSEEQVRGFFQQFGNIEEISMQPYKHLAIVKYDGWGAANAAYRSPKVIFNNRFVRVFWYREEMKDRLIDAAGDGMKRPNPTNGEDDSQGEGYASGGMEIDMEEFMRKQQEAQKIHEEKQKKRLELEQQREELQKRQQELLDKHREEKRKLQEKLGAASKGSDGEADITLNKPSSVGPVTNALRSQLAALEAEAKMLGIDTETMDESSAWETSSYGRGRGRGYGYRGRGFAPRGFRGGFRGRGAIHTAYAAYSLDNRPKVVSVTGQDFTSPERDESLRHWLLGVGDFTEIQTSQSGAVITFGDRKIAEKFMSSIGDSKLIPGVDGEIEVDWVANGAVPSRAPLENGKPASAGGTNTVQDGRGHVTEPEAIEVDSGNGVMNAAQAGDQGQQNEMDYDVADENDWGIK